MQFLFAKEMDLSKTFLIISVFGNNCSLIVFIALFYPMLFLFNIKKLSYILYVLIYVYFIFFLFRVCMYIVYFNYKYNFLVSEKNCGNQKETFWRETKIERNF